jgi:hypothetical protein
LNRLILVIFLLVPSMVMAQVPTTGPFAPITLDAQKYQEIDAAVARMAMPREAHAAWMQMWQGIEQRAQQEAMAVKAMEANKPK